eukprot:sb/3468681/
MTPIAKVRIKGRRGRGDGEEGRRGRGYEEGRRGRDDCGGKEDKNREYHPCKDGEYHPSDHTPGMIDHGIDGRATIQLIENLTDLEHDDDDVDDVSRDTVSRDTQSRERSVPPCDLNVIRETPHDIMRLQLLVKSGKHLETTSPAPEIEEIPQVQDNAKSQYRCLQTRWDKKRMKIRRQRSFSAPKSVSREPPSTTTNKSREIKSKETFYKCKSKFEKTEDAADDISIIRCTPRNGKKEKGKRQRSKSSRYY